MKFLRLTLVAPEGTLIQFGETSFARGGWEVRDTRKKPLLHGSFRISHFVLFRISDFGQRQHFRLVITFSLVKLLFQRDMF